MLVGTTTALILISFLLIIALKNVKLGLLSLIPNLFPAAMGFGLWGYLQGEVGALSVVAAMTLGIVVDDTVHYLSKYLRGRREQGLSPEQATLMLLKMWICTEHNNFSLVAGFTAVFFWF